ncbi:expressed unknown protein [Seminavis robusta]|uniref:Uncharacterized protein n=1 Tax=Seminavis robusta TaxID=568900 RepID=A0A9N8DRN9_9STRA|nr:expressed unknown protein [Seminavis robusta]|eukprot:Sro205_g086280.1 n/a (218) ;mRNA; r:57938-58591
MIPNFSVPSPGLSRDVSGGSTISTGNSKRRSSGTFKKLSFNKKNLCSVSFGGVEQREIAHIPYECAYDVYYTALELKELRREEVIAVRRAMANSDDGQDMESDELTWRGIEDFRDGTNKMERSMMHTLNVLKEFHTQQNSGFSDTHQLRQISKQLSRQDRQNAQNRGASDAQAVGYKVKRSSSMASFKTKLQAPFSALLNKGQASVSFKVNMAPPAC